MTKFYPTHMRSLFKEGKLAAFKALLELGFVSETQEASKYTLLLSRANMPWAHNKRLLPACKIQNRTINTVSIWQSSLRKKNLSASLYFDQRPAIAAWLSCSGSQILTTWCPALTQTWKNYEFHPVFILSNSLPMQQPTITGQLSCFGFTFKETKGHPHILKSTRWIS